jgi:hypothetical protein
LIKFLTGNPARGGTAACCRGIFNYFEAVRFAGKADEVERCFFADKINCIVSFKSAAV